VSSGGPVRTGGGYRSLRLFFCDIVCSCSWLSCLNLITLDLIGQVSSLVTGATGVNQAKCVLANRETNSTQGLTAEIRNCLKLFTETVRAVKINKRGIIDTTALCRFQGKCCDCSLSWPTKARPPLGSLSFTARQVQFTPDQHT
jgi:hypothetical protein